MVRHSRIHRTSTASKPRRRCHTACDSCRCLRSKCDGQQPCANCSTSQVSCVYTSNNRRLSEKVGETSPLADATSYEVSELPTDGSAATIFENESHEFDLFTGSTEMITGDDSDSFNITNSQTNNALTDWSYDGLWPFSTAWQWTHEDLYLQQPADIFGSTDGAFSTALLFGDQNSGNPYETPLASEAMATASMTPVSSSQRPTELELLAHCEDNIQLQPARVRTCLKRDLEAVTAQLVKIAGSEDAYSRRRTLNWHELDEQLSSMISIAQNQQSSCDSPRCLDYLCEQYFIHFHPLWPLMIDSKIDLRTLHPLLFLTLASIGALYHKLRSAVQFGSILHSSIRDVLIRKHVGSDQKATEALDIGRAMLLTQVAALYFEQEKAFSTAQQLGAKLNVQGHRMQLFSETPRGLFSEPRPCNEAGAIAAEGRRMLAYGMLRAEAFISVFFNRKPLLSYEEVNLPLPQIGFSENAATAFTVSSLVDQSASLPCTPMLFSDLVRIALDEEEVLPAMKPTDLELLLFGLQTDAWRFCQDHGIFRRLIQQRQPNDTIQLEHSSTGVDLLDQTTRKMSKLISDYNAIIAALKRWKAALSLSQLSHPPNTDRSAYLSGLILYELSFLRLLAPIETILQIVYRYEEVCEGHSIINEVLEWTASPKATESVAHAQSVCQLLHAETSRPPERQAKYNILTLIAVHHAAAVTWAVIGSGQHQQDCFEVTDLLNGSNNLTLAAENTSSIISYLASLYPKITSSRGVQSSFHKIVKRLENLVFPLTSALRTPAERSNRQQFHN